MARKYKPLWPARRLDDLDRLKKLLYEIASLESGNNHIARSKRIMKLAEKLRERNRDRTIPSFHEFLQTLAWKEIDESKQDALAR